MPLSKAFPVLGLCFFALGILLPSYTFLTNKFYLLCLSIIFSGWQVFRSACISVANFRVDANLLITLAIIGLISLSMFLEAALYMCLIGLLTFTQTNIAAKLLDRIKSRWQQKQPDCAVKLFDGKEQTVAAQEIRQDDLLCLVSGHKNAVDAIVESGEGEVGQSLFSRNNPCIHVREGCFVAAGTPLVQGQISLRAIAAQEQSLFSRLKVMIEQAAVQKSDAETQNYNQGTAKRLLTLIFFMILPFFFFKVSLVTWLNYSITFLLIFAPYNALIEMAGLLAAHAIDKAAGFGIIVNEPLALEEAAKVKSVAFEKETTLTTGKLILNNTYAPYPFTRKEVLFVAAVVANAAHHPLARSILTHWEEGALPESEAVKLLANEDFNVQAQFDGKDVLLGRNAFLEQQGVKTSALLRKYAEYLTQGSTVLFVAINGEPAGLISFVDDVHHQVYVTISKIKTDVVPDVVMLTKEQERHTLSKTKPYGFSEVMSNLNEMAKKAPAIQKLHFDYGSILVVGDARQDTATMQNADVSVAVNAEKDLAAAEKTADIMLLGNYFNSLPQMFALGKNSINSLSLYKKISFLSKLALLFLSFFSYLYLWQIILIDGLLGVIMLLNFSRSVRKTVE